MKSRTAGDAPKRQDQAAILANRVRTTCRTRHYAPRTERAYASWVRAFVRACGTPPPAGSAEPVVAAFVRGLPATRRAAAATQSQAASAVRFLYREVLGTPLPRLEGIRRPRAPVGPPRTLSRGDVRALLEELAGPVKTIATLLYYAGLRLSECLQLRAGDVDLGRLTLTVRRRGGPPDRIVPVPVTLREPLARRLEEVRRLHAGDGGRGLVGGCPLGGPARGDPASPGTPYLFTASRDRPGADGTRARGGPVSDSTVQRAIAAAARRAGLRMSAPCRTLRHSYAAHLKDEGVDVRLAQGLLGHADVSTTRVYWRRLAEPVRTTGGRAGVPLSCQRDDEGVS